jgi:3-hydroxyisobutyrate dehydrogenase-like beta-hydroxyacid dehydrogenase
MKIAVLGLGIIGSRAAANLQSNPDHEVRLWSRTARGIPAEKVSIAAAVDGVEAIACYLKDSEALRQVMAEIELSANTSPTLLNHSTIDLETTRWLADRCASLGWGFLDAPFTGSRDAAQNRQLVYYVGGALDTIEAFKPILMETGREVIPCGEPGTATILKLVTNLISACSVQAMAEALATATKHGIAPEALISAVGSNACGSPLANMKLPTMAAGEFDTHFSLSNMLKDSRYVLDLAQGLETPAIKAVSQRMGELCDQGMAELDYSALAKPYLDT